MQQFVTGVEQVLQILDNRQAGADVGVVEEFASGAARRVAQLMVVIQR